MNSGIMLKQFAQCYCYGQDLSNHKIGPHEIEKKNTSALVYEVNERDKNILILFVIDLKYNVHHKLMLLTTIYVTYFISVIIILRLYFS